MTEPNWGEIYAEARAPRPPRRFTVLLPVHRPPAMLGYAVRSVLAQSDRNFELLILCDGAPPETAEAARQLAAMDPRIRVFNFPKGARHGEAHRAAVLDGARSKFVAQTADDDLWLPDHLSNLARLLRRADFGNVLRINLHPKRIAHHHAVFSLADPAVRERMLSERWNFFGPTDAGYRLAAYRRLPEGWTPAPEGVWTDLHMWRKFLRHPGLRLRSSLAAGGLSLPQPLWNACSLDERAAVNRELLAMISDPIARAGFLRQLNRSLAHSLTPKALRSLLLWQPRLAMTLLMLRRGPPLEGPISW